MTDYVYINRYGQYARLQDDPEATGAGITDDLQHASVISPAQKDSLDCNARRRLNRDFTALPATEQRTVRLETGTPYPKPGEYVDVDPADLAAREMDSGTAAERQPGDRSEVDWSDLPSRPYNPLGHCVPQPQVDQSRSIQRLRDLLNDARLEMNVARKALSPGSGQTINRKVLRERLEAICKCITEELER